MLDFLKTSTPPRDLSISLAAPPNWTFAPGDTIIGNIVRKTHLVTPEASLKLSLRGITATESETYDGDSTHTYRSHWDLWPVTWDEAFRGPLHIAEGSGADEYLICPFEVTLPQRPSGALIKRYPAEQSYRPLDGDSIAQQGLPGSFKCATLGCSNSCHGCIEYFLEAVLRYTRGGSLMTCRATCRVVLRHTKAPSEPPVLCYETKQWRSGPQTVQSQLLEPGRGDARLTFMQKTHKFFGSSRVPKFTYRVEVCAPSAVQLDNPLLIPFTVKAVPQLGPERTSSSIRNSLHPIQIKIHSLKLTIDAKTGLRASAMPYTNRIDYDQHTTRHTEVLDCNPPLSLSIGGDEVETETIDLGQLFEINLRTDGLHWSGRRRPLWQTIFNSQSVYPDFVSYLMKHWHWICWEIVLGVAGEKQKVKGKAELRVLAAD